MRITINSIKKETSSECVMLDKYGNIYNCIDNLYHPNPGTEEDEYSEIERTIDWLVSNNIFPVYPLITNWIRSRVANMLSEDADCDDLIESVMYSDTYSVCDKLERIIESTAETTLANQNYMNESLGIDELACARRISDYLNEHFLRVRANGKLNPNNENAIYFRISSHGYDWREVILDFMWDVFGSIDNMPNRIWIGHDLETNPPEVVLFDGSPEELFNKYDSNIFASNKLTMI